MPKKIERQIKNVYVQPRRTSKPGEEGGKASKAAGGSKGIADAKNKGKDIVYQRQAKNTLFMKRYNSYKDALRRQNMNKIAGFGGIDGLLNGASAMIDSTGKMITKAGKEVVTELGKVAPEPIYASGQPKVRDNVKVRDKDGNWNSEEILQKMTQHDYTLDTVDDDNRCAAASKVAAAVMEGPQAVKDLAVDIESKVDLTPDEQAAIDRIKNDNATYGDLGLLQDLAYANTVTENELIDETGVATASLDDIMKLGGSTSRNAPSDNPRDVADALQDGEKTIMYVDTNRDGAGDHFVLVGKTDDGRRYVYDPETKYGNQLTFEDQNKDAFDHYVDTMGKAVPNTKIWHD